MDNLLGVEAFLLTALKVVMINVVLSADNAVAIALACRNLPKEQQKKAYIWGSFGVVVLMIVLTYVAMWLLRIPFLQAIGGILLIWIAIKLLKGEDDEESTIAQHTELKDAIRTIIVADVVMSLDNTVAVAASAGGNLIIIGIGLAVSIPLVVWGANLLTRVMNRVPLIVYIGAALLGYTAGDLIIGDRLVGTALYNFVPAFAWILPWVIAALVLIIGLIQARKEMWRWRFRRKQKA